MRTPLLGGATEEREGKAEASDFLKGRDTGDIIGFDMGETKCTT